MWKKCESIFRNERGLKSLLVLFLDFIYPKNLGIFYVNSSQKMFGLIFCFLYFMLYITLFPSSLILTKNFDVFYYILKIIQRIDLKIIIYKTQLK